MEYALWECIIEPGTRYYKSCLNPYSNGICSMSINKIEKLDKLNNVLILILMEYALWVMSKMKTTIKSKES